MGAGDAADDGRISRDDLVHIAREAGLHVYVGHIDPGASFRQTDVIDGFLERLGFSPGPDPDVQRWRSLVHPDDAAAYATAFDEREAVRTPRSCAYRIAVPGHGERFVVERCAPAGRDGARVRLAGVITDITDAVEADRRAATMAESLGVTFWDVLIAPDGTYRPAVHGVASDRWFGDDDARFLGGQPPTRAGSVDAVWKEHIHPDDVPLWTAAFVREHRVGDRIAVEYRVVGIDGVVRVVSETGLVRGIATDGSAHVEGVIVDVTEAAATRRRADDLERRLAAILEDVDVLVASVRVAADGSVREEFRGPGATQLLGVEPGAETAILDVLVARVVGADRAALKRALHAARRGRTTEHRFRITTDAGTRWLLARWHPAPPCPDGSRVVDCLYTDVTAEEEAAAALARARDEAERRLRTDDLTGVASRPHGLDELARLLAGDAPVAVALFDIDHFKRVNDIHLHAGGDVVLRAVAHRLAAAHQGVVARFGGEEFLLVRSLADGIDARHSLEMLRRGAGAEPVRMRDEDLRVSLSAGLAIVEPGTEVEDAIGRADRALHAAKRRGRDRLVLDVDVEPDEVLADDPEAVRLAEGMSRAVADHEGDADLHCRRVSDLAGAVADELGLGATARLRCRIAGLVHDVGKIAVPATILRKPGRLDPDERRIMEKHAAVGAEIVAGIPRLADTASAVRHHHERWDGGGYPDGLAGAAIPIESRVLAAVDAWSAMTEPRVYRPALAREEALAELRAAAGGQLDPDVVGALLRVLGCPEATAAERSPAA